MTSLFEGCGTEDGRIAPAHAPDDMDGDRRAMTLPGLLGAWLRRLRSPVFRPGSSRPGGAPRRGLLPVALPCLSFATVLAGAAAAQEVSLSESRYGVWEGNSVVIGVGIDNPKPTAFTLDYTLSGGTASGADVAGGFGTRSITVPENAKTASISIATVQDSIRDEGTETFSVQLSTSEPGIVFGRGTAEVSISDDDTTPTSTFESTSSSANEGAGTHHVTVRLSPAPTTNIKLAIQYALQPPRIRHPRLHDGGTATPGSDYVMPHSRSYSYGEFSYVAVPAGATTVTVPVTIVDDNDLEGDETVVLRYYGTAPERDHRGRYLVRSRTPHRRHTLTIVDNEPRVSFASASQRVSEGSGTRNVGVTLSPAPTTDVTFTYTVGGTATAGSDFTIADSGTVTVPKGATTATIPVTVIDDTAPESNETVLLTLAASGGYQVASPGTHTLTIVDNEQTVSFASASQRVGEGSGTHNVGVTLLPAPTTDITFTYTVGGTATAGSDFTIASSGTVTVLAGATTATIPVAVINDTAPEGDETVDLTLAPPSGYRVVSPGTHTLTIVDDESSGSLSESRYGVWEGNSVVIKVSFDNPRPTAFTLDYTLSGGTASGADVAGGFGTRSITVPENAGRVSIPIATVQDSIQDEGTETFSVQLSTSEPGIVFGHGTAEVSISDDDTTPTSTFESASSSVDEGAGTHHVTVRLSPAPTTKAKLVIAYALQDPRRRHPYLYDGSTATPGSDYVIPHSRSYTYTKFSIIPVPAGATTVTVPVTIVDDSDPEGDETVILHYRYVTPDRDHGGHHLIRPGTPHSTHTLTIVDNDLSANPEVSFASAFQDVGEGPGTHDVTVNLSVRVASPVTVKYTVGGTATPGADYAALSGTVTVPAGEATATVPVTIPDDGVDDAGETVVLTLAAGEGYRVGSRNTHRLNIDFGPVVYFPYTADGSVVSESAGTRNVTVNLSAGPVSPITLNYTVGGTATPGADYEALSGTVTVPAGATTATIPITIIDDTHEDSRERIRLTLAGGTGYRVITRDNFPRRPWGGPHGHHTVVILNHESEDLEGRVQARLDMAVADGDSASANLWRRALAAVRGEAPPDGLEALTAADAWALAATHAGGGDTELASLWEEIAEVIGDGTANPPPEPAVTITAGASPVTEGGDAAFTLTATPAPAADLPVSVTVAADGDYGVTAGPQTVTLPTTGSAVLTLATTGDDADEPDGSVTVTIKDGDGYTVGGSASGSVTVRDDDDASPDYTDYQTVVNYLIEVRDNPKNTAVKGNPVHIAKWNRVLEAVGHDTGTGVAPMAASDIHANAALWPDSPFTAASVYLKSQEQDPDEPAVTVSAGTSPVTEGGSASFTLTATPPPAADLAVSVTVATDGAYGITAGPRTVTIPTTGSATLTLATTGDDADEPDGSVTVTVTDGAGYTVGASASGSITIEDDDAPATTPDWTDYQTVVSYLIEVRDNPKNTAVKDNPVHIAKWNRVLEALGHDTGTGVAPMAAFEIHANAAQWPDSPFNAASVYLKSQEQQQEPAVTVSAGTSPVTEGADASFTLTATPPPAADLAVSVTVATDGAYGITAGPQTVTIPTTGSATLTLATTDDATDEPDGSVSATVTDGDGYTVGSSASGSVTVRDDDEPPPDTPAVTLSAGNAVTEGGSATFTLTASPAPAADLAVSVTVAATGAYGIAAGPQTVTIPTTGIATLTLATTDDTTNEPDGSVTVTVTDGSGYTVGDPASGTVAIRDDDVPVVTVSGGSAVTEGGNASFTLTANPVPAASLAVSVTVATAGEYGVTAGKRTVSLPTTGSYTLTLATTDDTTDEPNGSVSVTVEDGEGYTVGASASGTITLRDDDEPPPVVTIAAKAASVTEGGDAVFALTADRASASALTVELSVSETGAGDHVAAADEGPATVTIPKDATEATFSVATVNDATDEPDSSASVAVQPGAGYTVGAPASASVEVTDDDAPSAAPALSVGDSTAKEGARFPVMPFTVRLTPPAPGPVRVHVSTRPSAPVSAEPGRDYAPGSSALTFRAGETEKQVWILIYDDSHDEGAETFEVVLSQAEGATIGDGVAVGTIVNDDPMPAAWLARFGRTVAEQALDGIAGRMSAPRTPGMQGTLAGQAVSFDPAAAGTPAAGGVPSAAGTPEGSAALAMADIARGFGGHSGHDPAGFGNGPGFMSPGSMSGTGGAVGIGFGQTPPHSRTMTARDALLGSSFSLTGQPDGSGGSMAFWGRASQGSFDGREGTFSLDGEATTALLGADYARGKWLIGLALAQSDGEGDYRDTGIAARAASQDCPAEAEDLCRGAVREGDGKVEASLTAAVPYAALRVSERLKLWGAAGYGSGEVTLKTELGGRYKADTTWRMAATGMRGDLLEAPAEGSGPALAATSDALWTRTSSEKTDQLAASDSDVTRLRVGLEGGYHVALEDGGSLAPKLELGARHDGGDAETGFGLELGGGLAWSDPALGLTLDVSGRALLAHENDDLEDRGFAASLGFDPSPASERGPSLTLRQAFGGQAVGGLDALFAPDPLEDRMGGEAASRWTMEAAYGVPAFGGRFTGSPHVGLGLSAAARDYTLGWRWTPEAASTPDLSFGFRAMRRESDSAAPEHTVGFEIRATW